MAAILSERCANQIRISTIFALLSLLSVRILVADTPVAMYIFPAGGQRGTEVKFHVGGLYLHEACPFEMLGDGVDASPRIEQTKTIWFEGPVIPLPDSQQAEDYPKDLAGRVKIAGDASLGVRAWRVWTAQGAVPARTFVVGDLPEVVEQEIDGRPIPVRVSLPVTINGRIFPREDVDIWSFEAQAGQSITCAAIDGGSLGSPLDARLEVRDPQGRRIAESAEAGLNADAIVRFTAPMDGTYQVHIHDIRFGGLQHYVYRLTITAGPWIDRVYPLGGKRGTISRFELVGQKVSASPVEVALPVEGGASFEYRITSDNRSSNAVSIDLDELPEIVESEANEEPALVEPREVPAVLNGRIERPGDVDFWAFRAAKGEIHEFDLRAARLGSPLDSVLVIADASGKELARSDDISSSQPDSQLTFTAPADGTFFARVEDRLSSRGGPAFAYRLRVARPPDPIFRLQLAADALSINRGGEAKLKVRAERLGGFAGEIKLEIDNLPRSVSVDKTTIAPNARELDLIFKAEAGAPIAAQPVVIRGRGTINEQATTRTASFKLAGNDLELDQLFVAVCVPTPFQVKGVFETKYAARGGVFVRHFSIDRNGFEGPLEVRLGDKQARHLQGVNGPTITVPAGVSEFDYPVYMPPWMEIGRTSRTVVMAVGEVSDFDGLNHKVSFTSVNQNEQIVALVDPGQLTLDIDRKSVAVAAEQSTELRFRVGRGQSVSGPVTVELVVPEHIRGVGAAVVTLTASESTGVLQLRISSDRPGPLNMPLVVRATGKKDQKSPVVAEALLEVVGVP